MALPIIILADRLLAVVRATGWNILRLVKSCRLLGVRLLDLVVSFTCSQQELLHVLLHLSSYKYFAPFSGAVSRR